MSKVLVDRELLRDSSAELSDWRMSFPDADSGMTDRLVGEIDAILAQPAEAEGVEVLARGYFHALPEENDYNFHDSADMGGECAGCVPAVIVSSASLSAVTAERDRLLEQVKALQSDANSWQSGYDKGCSDGAKAAEGWKEQHCRDSAELRRLCSERDQLRADLAAAIEQRDHYARRVLQIETK